MSPARSEAVCHESGTRMKLPALLTAGCLAATGLVAVAPSSSAVEPAAGATGAVQAVDWARCDGPTMRQLGAQCGFVRVPLDYSRPRGARSCLRCPA